MPGILLLQSEGELFDPLGTLPEGRLQPLRTVAEFISSFADGGRNRSHLLRGIAFARIYLTVEAGARGVAEPLGIGSKFATHCGGIFSTLIL
ncbi:MAG: hypothetical protein ABIN83_06660 [Sphingomicrobium sp.]